MSRITSRALALIILTALPTLAAAQSNPPLSGIAVGPQPATAASLGALQIANNLSELTATAATARGNIGAAASGANADITSLTALATVSGSPNFSGTPTFANALALGSSTATTQSSGTNNTTIATTAFTNAIFAAPPSLGSTTPGNVSATTLSASTNLKVTGSTTPTMAAGTLAFSGTATFPAFGTSGEGACATSTTLGLVCGGAGSVNDVTWQNESAVVWLKVPVNSIAAVFPGSIGIGTAGSEGNGSIDAQTYWANGTQGLASKSCLINTANAVTGITLTITEGLITGTTTC